MRLSQVIGEGVQLDRQTGRGFEAAFANLPITQGGVLRTGNGVAEVEFEDNSSLRLTPQSIVAFPVLSLGPDGTRSSTVHVLKGAVYASLTKSKQNNVSGGSAPNGFKGFADVAPQTCGGGGTWTSTGGNSAGAPKTVPSYMGVIASSSVRKSGNDVSGNVPYIVVVKTNPGYGSNPGADGTGTVVATYCHP